MKQQVISFHYTLKDKSGKTIESSYKADPIFCLQGSGQIIPALEKAISTLHKGDKKSVSLKASDAYGDHDKKLIMDVPRTQLPEMPEELKQGHQFQSESTDGHLQIFTVTKLTDSHVTLDGNHPLAGQDLTFDVEIMEKREATEEELQHGHAHGPGGHHHH